MSARILVVDDSPLIIKVLTARLEHEHYLVSAAADGFEALAKITAERPDIVLLDVRMPGLDGFETCRRIKADPATAHIPVIIVTALANVDGLVKGFEVGADDFLIQPVNDLELIARVRYQLLRKQQFERAREEARIDPLTGAFNRRYFDAHALRLAARCPSPARDPIGRSRPSKADQRQLWPCCRRSSAEGGCQQGNVRRAPFGLCVADGRRRICRRDAGHGSRRRASDRRPSARTHCRRTRRRCRRLGQRRCRRVEARRRGGARHNAPAG